MYVNNNFTDKPTFDSYSDLITSTEGDNVFVTLQARGRPSQITYKWFKNNEPLYSAHNRRIRDSTMNITGVLRDDAGNYTCEASNSEGFTTFWFVLSIKRKHFTFSRTRGCCVFVLNLKKKFFNI